MMHACPGVGATPMIRMPDALEANMQKAYDLGILGTIVPTVDDVFEARDAARWARFPPIGRRSQGGSQFWNNFLNPGETYRNSIDDNVLSVVMIETVEGVDNAYESPRCLASMSSFSATATSRASAASRKPTTAIRISSRKCAMRRTRPENTGAMRAFNLPPEIA